MGPPVFVCGDSHTLPTAWQRVIVEGISRVLVPKLVTGLKHWHLRPESDFYPKVLPTLCGLHTPPPAFTPPSSER